MVFFTNIGIGTEQQEDRYHYQYLYSSNSLYINGLCIGFLRYPCGSGLLFTLQQALHYEKPYKYMCSSVYCWKAYHTVFTNEVVIEYLCNKRRVTG